MLSRTFLPIHQIINVAPVERTFGLCGSDAVMHVIPCGYHIPAVMNPFRRFSNALASPLSLSKSKTEGN